ncbi:multi-sensor hybrid histidine kinase [Stylonychia lemnae]|uniref:histidine kinase n=1 Tax=Stylonychia lemnae TaxID=5949 RepID=A0A078AZH3_STYLE|nr:multi-sensor hybrid histidine kinase [Stylonychia lemnae]|eukprot:CDW87511.1 multi-sensor hybrid histidine kinase [Stylonychia lemnae]
MIKIFHDGIIIATKDKILYHNEQALSIFGIKEEELQSSRYSNSGARARLNQELGQQQDIEQIPKFLIDQMKETIIDNIECKNMGINIQQMYRFEFKNLWNYLEHKFQGNRFNNLDSEVSNIDGVPFLVGNDQQNHSSSQKSEQKHIQVFTQSMKQNGKETILIALRDMTTWIEFERQENLNKMKTVLFAQAAHEFRNPLNGIISSIDILHDKVNHETGGKYYQIAKNCANLMLFLVNDILDFAQTEQKKLVLNIERFKIKDLIEQCTNILQFSAELKGLKIILSLENSAPMYFTTDQNRLRQILINLLSNAIKYTRKGFIKIIINSTEKQTLQIQVVDTGVGISEEKIKTLFSIFTKIMEDRELNKQGVGLGLSISKKLAQALGGDITVESEKDIGSTFILQIKNQEGQLKPSFSGQSSSHQQPKDQLFDVTSMNSLPQKLSDILITVPGKRQRAFHWLSSIQSQSTLNRHNQSFQTQQNALNEIEESKEDIKSEAFPDINLQLDFHDQIARIDSANFEQFNPLVLIADDQPFNLLSLEGLLEQQGVQVDKAFDGESAYLKVLSDQKRRFNTGRGYKLIILDNEMPLMSGLQVAIKIRQGQRNGIIDKHLKLALSSGESSNEFTRLLFSLNYGQDPFDYNIGKPVKQDIIKKMLLESGLKKS